VGVSIGSRNANELAIVIPNNIAMFATMGMNIAAVEVFDLTFDMNMIILTTKIIVTSKVKTATNESGSAIQAVSPELTKADANARPPPRRNSMPNGNLSTSAHSK